MKTSCNIKINYHPKLFFWLRNFEIEKHELILINLDKIKLVLNVDKLKTCILKLNQHLKLVLKPNIFEAPEKYLG